MSAANNKDLRMSYDIDRGELSMMSFEPYKSTLFPLWRLHNAEVATKSAMDLWERFLDYDDRNDFVGMDMARKLIQLGMIRTRMGSMPKGMRKHNDAGNILSTNEGHRRNQEMENASRMFQKHFDRARIHKGYNAKKRAFQREKTRKRKNEALEERAKVPRRRENNSRKRMSGLYHKR